MPEVRKFIIIENEVIMGLVEFHSELIPNTMKSYKPTGGGIWEYNPVKFPNKLFIFGRSIDYGSVTKEQFIEAWQNSSWLHPFLENCEIIFSDKQYFSEVLKENNL